MNRRYLILAILIITMILVGTVSAKWVWSIADPSVSSNAGIISDAESQGFWNFQYDDAAPFTTMGLTCCWWERWYKWQRFDQLKANGVGTVDSGSETSSASTSDTSSSAQVETKSSCPSCCATCDDSDPAALKAKSDAIMAKKPWLTEGKNKAQPSAVPTTATSMGGSDAPMVMTFSEAK